MTDIFMKGAVGVIALSLAVMATTDVLELIADSEARMAKTKPVTKFIGKSDKTMLANCRHNLSEELATLKALEDQITQVPSTIRAENTDDGAADNAPNRLYETMTASIIETKTKIEALTQRCNELDQKAAS